LLRELDGPPRYPIMTRMWGMALGPPENDSQTWHRRHRLVGADQWSGALTFVGDGLIARMQGDPETARDLLARGGQAFECVGDRWGAALAHHQLGEMALEAGEPGVALEAIGRAHRLLTELDATEDIAELLVVRARARLASGDFEGAAVDYDEALGQATRAGSPLVRATCHLGRAELARLTGDLDTAWAECDRAWELTPGGWYSPDETRCHIAFERGRIAKARGDDPAAREHLEEALRRAVGQRNLLTEAAVRAELAAPAGP
jgi:tetratricopeptide (TPR) repeat protein